MPSAVVGQAGAQGIQKSQSKATVETADTSKVPASSKVRKLPARGSGIVFACLD